MDFAHWKDNSSSKFVYLAASQEIKLCELVENSHELTWVMLCMFFPPMYSFISLIDAKVQFHFIIPSHKHTEPHNCILFEVHGVFYQSFPKNQNDFVFAQNELKCYVHNMMNLRNKQVLNIHSQILPLDGENWGWSWQTFLYTSD